MVDVLCVDKSYEKWQDIYIVNQYFIGVASQFHFS